MGQHALGCGNFLFGDQVEACDSSGEPACSNTHETQGTHFLHSCTGRSSDSCKAECTDTSAVQHCTTSAELAVVGSTEAVSQVPYVLARGRFLLGDRVEVRDDCLDEWLVGIVVEI